MKLNIPKILWLVSLTMSVVPLSSMEIDDLFSGKYRVKSVAGIRPSADGVHYTCLSPDRTCIVRYAYATGEAVDTLLNVGKVPGRPVKAIAGYSFGSKEDRMLVYTDVEMIYRRSFRATYYFTSVGSNKLHPFRSEFSNSKSQHFRPMVPGWRLCMKTIYM